MNRKDEAQKIHACGFNCSQAVLGVFCEELGMDLGSAYRISAGFGGGLRRGEVCGAVTGAIMALGLRYGHFVEGDIESKEMIAAKTKAFNDRFEAANGSLICKEMLGYNSAIEEERAIIVEKGLFDTVCPKAITTAVEIAEELIAD